MFIHTVMFWLRKDLTAVQRALFETEVRRLARIPYLERGYVGTPAETERRSVTDHSFDYAISLQFKTDADHDFYQDGCPEHARFVSACQSLWERVVVYDIVPLGQ
jgi:hypothetical protein